MRPHKEMQRGAVYCLIIFLCWTGAAAAAVAPSDWQRQAVDWRMPGGTRIKNVYYPPHKPLPLSAERTNRPEHQRRKKVEVSREISTGTALTEKSVENLTINVIDSPPLNGFVPWVAVTLTNARSTDDDFYAQPANSVVGSYLPADPQTGYAIGIYDTGAGVSLMGYDAATRTGLTNTYITDSVVTLGGVTGTIEAQVSYPLGLFVEGLGAIDPDSLLLDTSGMVGETNVSIAAGYEPQPEAPDLPTAIGAPFSVFFITDFRNDHPITIVRDANEYTCPDIHLYSYGSTDPNIPEYANYFPLEIRPAGSVVAYFPTIDLETMEFYPFYPSGIFGNSVQSQFFVHSVNLGEGAHSLIDKDSFIFDTGAQVSVISSSIASSLGLSTPEFWVEIVGVNGQSVMKPGYYVDSLEIPAIDEWLSFSDIPVVMLDVTSAEGLTADGIIGMNLFVGLNFALRGGAFDLDPETPKIEFEFIPVMGDIAPPGGDGKVDFLDLAAFVEAWLSDPFSLHWNQQADMAPVAQPDNLVNLLDFAVLAQHWLEGTTP